MYRSSLTRQQLGPVSSLWSHESAEMCSNHVEKPRRSLDTSCILYKALLGPGRADDLVCPIVSFISCHVDSCSQFEQHFCMQTTELFHSPSVLCLLSLLFLIICSPCLQVALQIFDASSYFDRDPLISLTPDLYLFAQMLDFFWLLCCLRLSPLILYANSFFFLR